jgi:hypothetical protein
MAVNEALIRGAAVAAGPVVDYFGAFSKGFESTYGPLMEQRKAKLEADQKKKASEDAKMIKLLEGVEDIDIAGLNPQEQKEIATKAFGWKKEYSEIASKLARISASDDPELYMQLSGELNSINNRFVNLTNNLKVYKTNKLDWADNTKAGKYSIINGDNLTNANNYYTGDLSVSADGGISYGGVTEVPQLITNDRGKAVGALIKEETDKIEKLKRPLTENEARAYRDDLKAVITPEVAKMVVKENNIIPGIRAEYFIDFDDSLFNEGKESELVDAVVNRLATGLSDVALEYANLEEQKAQKEIESKEAAYLRRKRIDQQFKSDNDKPTQTEITRTQKLEKIEKRAKKRVDSILKNPVLAVLAVQGVVKEEVERDPKNPRVIVIKGEDGDLRFDTNNKSDISKLAKTLEQIEFGADAITDDVKLAIDDYIAERRKKRNPLLDE